MSKRGTILLVDDDSATRELYRRELEDEGYAVVTATDSNGALDAVEAWSPSLAVLDIHLSAQDCGLDLLRALLERRSLQTILLTAYGGYRDDFSAWLADAFVMKSGDTTEFKATVDRLLSPLAPPPRSATA